MKYSNDINIVAALRTNLKHLLSLKTVTSPGYEGRDLASETTQAAALLP